MPTTFISGKSKNPLDYTAPAKKSLFHDSRLSSTHGAVLSTASIIVERIVYVNTGNEKFYSFQ